MNCNSNGVKCSQSNFFSAHDLYNYFVSLTVRHRNQQQQLWEKLNLTFFLDQMPVNKSFTRL